jgi:hypothetical protein
MRLGGGQIDNPAHHHNYRENQRAPRRNQKWAKPLGKSSGKKIA